MAVHDLFGQRYGLPLYRFFGGRKTRIASDLTISVNAPDTMLPTPSRPFLAATAT